LVAGVIQGFVAALFVLPVARLLMGPVVGITFEEVERLAAVILLGGASFSALGLLLGTAISAEQIGLMFSVIVAPMIFFGAAYYPWAGLDAVPVMKWVVLVNPLVYVAEGMRAALTPELPHMPMPAILAGLTATTALFWTLGYRTFLKRAIG
ncbi:MAG TPA: ABC transporter permease, partial [Longimicrobiales bacterium]|nr:ABC transporter permease [Longimicrobiales bacterium]